MTLSPPKIKYIFIYFFIELLFNHFNIYSYIAIIPMYRNKNIIFFLGLFILLKFIQKLLLLRGVTVCVLAEQQVGSCSVLSG